MGRTSYDVNAKQFVSIFMSNMGDIENSTAVSVQLGDGEKSPRSRGTQRSDAGCRATREFAKTNGQDQRLLSVRGRR
jgi:hypothetical protein